MTIEAGAVISPCRKYRYQLSRVWDKDLPLVVFLMLNPSTADEQDDDNTIRRCIGFARSWGYGGLLVGNLFGYRASDASELFNNSVAIGVDNQQWLIDMTIGRTVICSWGAHPLAVDQARKILPIINGNCNISHLGLTKDGHPKHPLYLHSSCQPSKWDWHEGIYNKIHINNNITTNYDKNRIEFDSTNINQNALVDIVASTIIDFEVGTFQKQYNQVRFLGIESKHSLNLGYSITRQCFIADFVFKGKDKEKNLELCDNFIMHHGGERNSDGTLFVRIEPAFQEIEFLKSCITDYWDISLDVNVKVKSVKKASPSYTLDMDHQLFLRIPLMKNITIPASRVRQGALLLYTTSMKVRELIADGFYNVETLDPENSNDKGYQRLLNKARAKKLADYIIKGQDSQDAFLPTSVFIATDKNIEYNSIDNTIEIDTSLVCPFSVVDGQHRLEGLKMAASKDERVLDFEVPVNIAVNLSKIAQMCHFLIVNTTQKSVDKSVEQRIIARLSDALDIEDLPSLPKWILNTVERGEVEKAVRYVDYLNEAIDSPWHGKIQMANNDSDEATINQRSFVKAIVKYVLTAHNPLTIINDFEKEKKIFLNYWKAISSILDDGNSTVLYKYNGVELFCKFSIPFFTKLQDTGNFTVSTMEKMLSSCLENVEGDYATVGHPDWWKKGGKASFLNAGAINVVSQEMSKALHKASMSSSIQI